MSKLLLLFIVAILVMKPQNAADLYIKLRDLYLKYYKLRGNLINFWDKEVQKEIDLTNNLHKALDADAIYKQKSPTTKHDL